MLAIKVLPAVGKTKKSGSGLTSHDDLDGNGRVYSTDPLDGAADKLLTGVTLNLVGWAEQCIVC